MCIYIYVYVYVYINIYIYIYKIMNSHLSRWFEEMELVRWFAALEHDRWFRDPESVLSKTWNMSDCSTNWKFAAAR